MRASNFRFLLVLLAVSPAAAQAQYVFESAPHLDHRGQWGLHVEPALTWISVADGDRTELGLAPGVEVGVSRAVTDTGDEISVRLRPVFSEAISGALVMAGWRTYFGLEHWKTFADVQLAAPLMGDVALGARVGLGVMYDPSRAWGVSLTTGAFGAVGERFVTGFDALAGVQLRF